MPGFEGEAYDSVVGRIIGRTARLRGVENMGNFEGSLLGIRVGGPGGPPYTGARYFKGNAARLRGLGRPGGLPLDFGL